MKFMQSFLSFFRYPKSTKTRHARAKRPKTTRPHTKRRTRRAYKMRGG